MSFVRNIDASIFLTLFDPILSMFTYDCCSTTKTDTNSKRWGFTGMYLWCCSSCGICNNSHTWKIKLHCIKYRLPDTIWRLNTWKRLRKQWDNLREPYGKQKESIISVSHKEEARWCVRLEHTSNHQLGNTGSLQERMEIGTKECAETGFHYLIVSFSDHQSIYQICT